jgi:putative methionine-R-sulfoxide reductase with GAF domain
MGGAGGPHPGDGVVVLYENVRLAVTGGIVTVAVTTEKSVIVTQVNQKSGYVTGVSSAPKE